MKNILIILPAVFMVVLVLSNSALAETRVREQCYFENGVNNNYDSSVILGVLNKLCERWQGEYEKIIWSVLSAENKKELNLEAGSITYDIGEMRNGRVWVRANGLIDKRKSSVTFWFRVKGFRTVWTAVRDISGETYLHKRDMVKVVKEVATVNLKYEQITFNPEGMYVYKPLRKGQIISVLNVDEPPLIERNQKIQILVKNNNLQIVASAVSLSIGQRAGDLITIQVSGAEKSTRAIVAEKGLAYVSN